MVVAEYMVVEYMVVEYFATVVTLYLPAPLPIAVLPFINVPVRVEEVFSAFGINKVKSLRLVYWLGGV